MSRSGYSDDITTWSLIRWRGAVASAIRGKRGQAFLNELLTSLDGLPEKRLIADELEMDGEVCALGAVGKSRGIDMATVDAHDPSQVANTFSIPPTLAQEIVYINDEHWSHPTPEERFKLVRDWIISHIKEPRP